MIVFGVSVETAPSYLCKVLDAILYRDLSYFQGLSLMIPREGAFWKFEKSGSLFTDRGTAGNYFYTTAARRARG